MVRTRRVAELEDELRRLRADLDDGRTPRARSVGELARAALRRVRRRLNS